MKFSHSLQFNAVPEWHDQYLAYSNLKKIIYELRELTIQNAQFETGNSSTAMNDTSNGSKSKLAFVEGSTNFKERFSSKFSDMKRFGKSLKKQRKQNDSGSNNDDDDEITAETYELDSVSTQELEYNQLDIEDVDFLKVTPKKFFENKLNSELKRIDKFYQTEQDSIFGEIEKLLSDLKYYQETKSDLQDIKSSNTTKVLDHDIERNGGLVDEDDDDVESTAAYSTLLGDREFNLSFQHEVSYKKRITENFVNLSQLKSFIELNKIAFSKVCKKFDKVLDEEIRQNYVNSLHTKSYMFNATTMDKVDEYLDELITIYAGVSGQSIEFSKNHLRSYLREHIVFERGTVWKDMIGIDPNNGKGSKVLTGDESELKNFYTLEYYTFKLPFTIDLKYTKIENFLFPKCFVSWKAFKIALAILVGGLLLGIKTLNDRTQGNCMAIVFVSAILWASEAIPLFATSMLIPFLVVTCNVLKDSDTGEVMDASDAATYIFSTMWNSTIMLLIGGFTLAAALSKYNIAKVVSSWIMFFAGTSPRRILFAIMAVALFLSMWISNVAAPVLAYSLISPVLKSIPSDSGFAKALVLGIALVSDIGGMSTPISSPQNMVAIEALTPQPSWGNWFSFSIPLCVIGLFVCWITMILTFNINTVKIKAMKPIKEQFTVKQYYIILVTVVTIVLWCTESQLESRLGASGIISLIPVVAFYGTGILTTTDVNNYPWSIVLLAMGGIALGKAVSSSGLLHTVAVSLSERIDTYPAIGVLAIFGVLCVVFATFVSHTVSALILVPLVQSVGQELHHENLLVCGIALIASVGMALPMSGFPNQIAISMTDDLGNRYLNAGLFISRGVPVSLIMFVLIITVGYGIMSSIGY
ncbi:hypothetical protein CANARDRAFT_29649 [[Candida] arabinofermentans NRRL YB-2248]|uniref:SPX domain-containing protein n=1 Tax=[Candida] arabinofermentans NRRL YB-2248 TaxID=983967 RepID=A0A1E4SWQ1_9ASCO|nr:hypothetical protein CANARDRAFT_29649 [[Candida] arabinofermentans NRRL YB-2248]